MPKVEIVAVADAFKDRAEVRGQDVQVEESQEQDYGQFVDQIKVTPETTFDGLDAYQKLLDAGVDLVILATPPGFRPYHLEAAVKAGKNIFCEKPVGVDATGIRKVLSPRRRGRRSKNIAIVAGTQRRHQKGYIETIKQIHDGAIGDVVAARVLLEQGGHLVPRPPARARPTSRTRSATGTTSSGSAATTSSSSTSTTST